MATKNTATETNETVDTVDPIRDLTLKLRKLDNSLKLMRRDLKIADKKLQYDDDDELRAERNAIIETIAKTEEDMEETRDELNRETERQNRARVDQERKRLMEASQSFNFEVPKDNVLLGLAMLSAIAQRLQYEYVRSQGPYEALITKVHGRGAGFEDNGSNTGVAGQDPNYEYNRSDIDKLDEIAERREYVMTLRFAVKREFENLMKDLPPDAPYIPRLLNQDDETRFVEIEERNQQKWLAQLEERRKVGQEAQKFTRKELNIM